MSDIVKIGKHELLEHAEEISAARRSDATREAYESDWRQFDYWAKENVVSIMPASEGTVVAYVVYLSKIGFKPITIQRKITAINQIHLSNGFGRTTGRLVREAVQGIRRLKGVARRRARPITWTVLDRILNQIQGTAIGIRDRALLLVGFSGALRRSELVAIDIEDIEFVDEGMIISQTHSKTNQEGELRKIAIPFVDIKCRCPVKATQRLIAYNQTQTGALFRGLGSGGRKMLDVKLGRRLSASSVSKIIKRYAELAGYPSSEFSGHSLRAGFATAASQAGLSSVAIMARTGHKSFAVFANYVLDGRLFSGHPLNAIVSHASSKSNSSPPQEPKEQQ